MWKYLLLALAAIAVVALASTLATSWMQSRDAQAAFADLEDAATPPLSVFDEAMLAGLLHNVGKIYILARANRHESLFKDALALPQVLRDWHANVGKAIVENWGFPSHIAEAIGEHENIDRDVMQPDVTDVLTVAVMMSSFMGHETDLELNMQGVKAFWRLHLDNAKCVHVTRDCSEEINALRTALGD